MDLVDKEKRTKKRKQRRPSLVLDFDDKGFFVAAESPLAAHSEDDESASEQSLSKSEYSSEKTQGNGDLAEHSHSHKCHHGHAHNCSSANHDNDVEIASPRQDEKKLPNHAYLLIIMMLMVGSFAVAEVVVGFASKSLAMLSDSFHMLSDVLSLIVGFTAMWLASKRDANDSKTYGWQRAEIIGGLVNGVFLISVCFYTITEAVVRLIEGPPELRDPWLIFGVGVGGLVINLIGMCMFCSHRSLAQHGHAGHSHGHSHGHGHNHDDGEQHEHDSNVNLHGVFLHVLGDTLGSIVVIGTALTYLFAKDNEDGTIATWKPYLDPVCSILFSFFILRAAIPLMKHTIHVLMQSVPENFDLDILRKDLLALDGVIAVHELHVWQQSAGDVIGTVHIETVLVEEVASHALQRQVKKTFCKYGVHRTTVQKELPPKENSMQRASLREKDHSCCEMTSSESSNTEDSSNFESTK